MPTCSHICGLHVHIRTCPHTRQRRNFSCCCFSLNKVFFFIPCQPWQLHQGKLINITVNAQRHMHTCPHALTLVVYTRTYICTCPRTRQRRNFSFFPLFFFLTQSSFYAMSAMTVNHTGDLHMYICTCPHRRQRRNFLHFLFVFLDAKSSFLCHVSHDSYWVNQGERKNIKVNAKRHTHTCPHWWSTHVLYIYARPHTKQRRNSLVFFSLSLLDARSSFSCHVS